MSRTSHTKSFIRASSFRRNCFKYFPTTTLGRAPLRLLFLLLLPILVCLRNQALGMTVVSVQNGERVDPSAAASASVDSVATSFLPTLKHAFPTAVSWDILDTIVQANAKGFKLQVHLQPSNEEDDHNNDNDQNNIKSSVVNVFWKQVRASDYVSVKNDWSDLRRTLLYARTETRRQC